MRHTAEPRRLNHGFVLNVARRHIDGHRKSTLVERRPRTLHRFVERDLSGEAGWRHRPASISIGRLRSLGVLLCHRHFGVLARMAAHENFPWRPRAAGVGRERSIVNDGLRPLSGPSAVPKADGRRLVCSAPMRVFKWYALVSRPQCDAALPDAGFGRATTSWQRHGLIRR